MKYYFILLNVLYIKVKKFIINNLVSNVKILEISFS